MPEIVVLSPICPLILLLPFHHSSSFFSPAALFLYLFICLVFGLVMRFNFVISLFLCALAFFRHRRRMGGVVTHRALHGSCNCFVCGTWISCMRNVDLYMNVKILYEKRKKPARENVQNPTVKMRLNSEIKWWAYFSLSLCLSQLCMRVVKVLRAIFIVAMPLLLPKQNGFGDAHTAWAWWVDARKKVSHTYNEIENVTKLPGVECVCVCVLLFFLFFASSNPVIFIILNSTPFWNRQCQPLTINGEESH